MTKITDLIPDGRNTNNHTERGHGMTRKSAGKFGPRKPLELDANNIIIDGNDRADIYADTDLTDPKNPAREYQIAQGRTAMLSYADDIESILEHMNEGLEVEDWYFESELDALIASIGAGVDGPKTKSKNSGDMNLGKMHSKFDFEIRDILPTAILSLPRNREFISDMTNQTLNKLIGGLPDIGTDVYILSNGNGAEKRDGSDDGTFDFGSFIPYFAEMVGAREIYVSTWTMNMRGADCLVALLETETINRMVVLTDPYFNRREPAISGRLLSAMRANENYHYVAFRNHTKIIMGKGDNGTAVISGSANLSSQPRVEQFILSTSPDVFNFYRDNLFEWAVSKLYAQQSKLLASISTL